MKRFLTDRVDRLGALGQAAADLARAEAGALRSELRGNARRLVGIALLFIFALFVAFWALGTLAFALVEVGALWLPRWAAALALVAVLALVAAVLGLVGRRRLTRMETPAATLKRRAEEAQGWWDERMAGPSRGEARAAGADSRVGARERREKISRRPDA